MEQRGLISSSKTTSAIEALKDVSKYRDRLYYAIKGQQEFPSEGGARYLQKMQEKYNESVLQVRGMFRVVR